MIPFRLLLQFLFGVSMRIIKKCTSRGYSTYGWKVCIDVRAHVHDYPDIDDYAKR